VGKENFQEFAQVWFSDFFVIGGQDCSQILVKLYWLGGLVFPSGFSTLIKLQNINFCLMCIDDSSLILLFPLDVFLVNNF
jgi:hypothetical protein